MTYRSMAVTTTVQLTAPFRLSRSERYHFTDSNFAVRRLAHNCSLN